jgi:hypothetical protein
MDLDGRPKAQRARSDLLALRLIELAIGAGWRPAECIEFAREAHNLVMSTLSEKVAVRTEESTEEKNGHLTTSRPTAKPEWGSNPETRRRALQTLADQNRTMAEAAEILGVSKGLVTSAAFKLKVSFHGRRSRPKVLRTPVRRIKRAPKFASAGHTHLNGKAAVSLAGNRDVNRHVQRRCPSCNRIFEPIEISQYLCDDCESGRNAGSPRP